MNAPSKNCTECGAKLADDAVAGLCPRCLLQAGMASDTDPNATVVDTGGRGPQRVLPNAGETFGPYRIVRLLGRGGMGVVYEAEEQETGRRVALKILGRQFDSPKDRARFLREGRLAASINHPNSVYVFGTDEINGSPTISMELVAGGTLQQRVKARGPMQVPHAVDAILQIIAGLEAAQAIGILHRDVKPGNCFEDADGTIKIGDFGLSISTAPRAEANITADGTMVGTPAFCSPEQLRGEELSARADMYSVGATLFYLLTGRVPFEGDNIVQLTANVLEKPTPSPREFRGEIPKGLAAIVQRCLAKQSSERFKSYDDLRRALTPYGSTAPTPATLSLRFLAGVLDNVVVTLANTVVLYFVFGNPMAWMTLAFERSPIEYWLWMLASISVVLLYYAFSEGVWGASAGKALCRLRVVGPDKNPPGFRRALLRAVLYVMLPALPAGIMNIAYAGDPRAMMSGSMGMQLMGFFVGLSFYVILGLLFSTARRRNGFAAVQDLATQTRVISRTALETRPSLAVVETPPPAVETKPMVGPYHVLETLDASGDEQWLLGYDLRLLRKLWIRTVPPGTPLVPAPLRGIGRVGRLRWLAGRRAPEENWDAFEAVGGKPLLQLIADRQPWSRVRFWLADLAHEMAAAQRDGSLPPVLALDRVWITAAGRAKLLDFPAPGLAAANPFRVEAPSAASPLPEAERVQHFLAEVALAALDDRPDALAKSDAEPAVPLPLHARTFLNSLPQLPGADAVLAALQPLLRRNTTVSRWRRAAVVAGCAVFPVLMSVFMMLGMTMMQRMAPNVQEILYVLQVRQIAASQAAELEFIDKINTSPSDKAILKQRQQNASGTTVTDRQIAIYLASHYRETISNDSVWNGPLALSMIKGKLRLFAEQSIADHPAPTEAEIADADAAVKPHIERFNAAARPPLGFMMLVTLTIYVAIPAWIAALAFRGGLVLWAAGVTFVRRDGRPASRPRVFWRALVAWTPAWAALIATIAFVDGAKNPLQSLDLPSAVFCGVLVALAVLSVALPDRGLPDRLAGTWPVPQ